MDSDTSKPVCQLLALPAEIRNQIYEIAVIESQPIRESRYSQLGLLHTCRQIREESTKMFYRQNTIRLDCHIFLNVLLESTQRYIHEMRYIQIHTGHCVRGTFWTTGHPVVLTLDLSMGLQQLKLEVYHDSASVHSGKRFQFCQWYTDVVDPDRACKSCRRLDTVQQYLNDCARTASPGRYMTTQIFEHITRILVGNR